MCAGVRAPPDGRFVFDVTAGMRDSARIHCQDDGCGIDDFYAVFVFCSGVLAVFLGFLGSEFTPSDGRKSLLCRREITITTISYSPLLMSSKASANGKGSSSC